MNLRMIFMNFFVTLYLFYPTSASSEVIYRENGDGGSVVIFGNIEQDDLTSFKEIVRTHPRPLVDLDSSGGLLMPALEIGKVIRELGLATAVHYGASCASSCALIWLAGQPRLLDRGGRVGFHASYLNYSGKAEESGVANALIGSYLTRLGFSEKAVIFATSAPPNQVIWLSEGNKAQADIQFTPSDSTTPPANRTLPDAREDSLTGENIGLPNQGNINRLPPHLPAKLSSGGSRWVSYTDASMFFDANSIQFVKNWDGEYEGRRFWALAVYPKNIAKEDLPKDWPKDLSYSLFQYFVYCPNRTVATEIWIDNFMDGRTKRQNRYETGGRGLPALPGSHKQELVNYVCAIERGG